MSERLIPVDGGELCIDTFGHDADPAVLLICGMGQSMDWWDVELCQLLADGRFVIRYDHRDTGRSSTSPAGAPSYSADDLVQDPLRILDALGIRRAHLVGISMGGGITQDLAALHPDRLLTVTLIATSPAGERVEQATLPPPLPDLVEHLRDADAPRWDDRAAVIDHLVEEQRHHFGPVRFEEDRVRELASAQVDRTLDMAATMTNHALAEGSSEAYRMVDLAVPTLVLHGTADPLFPIAHGEALAAEIPGATLLALDGMGHEIPPPRLWPVVVPAILQHTADGRP